MIIATTTVQTDRDAKLIAKVCFAEKLAACVQIDKIVSICHWQKEPREDNEYRLIFKTSDERLPALEKRVRELHRHELLEWVWWDASATQEYSDWINSQTK